MIDIEPVARRSLKSVEENRSPRFSQLQNRLQFLNLRANVSDAIISGLWTILLERPTSPFRANFRVADATGVGPFRPYSGVHGR
jgi:hypothetical protein